MSIFLKGDWLLVNADYTEGTIFIIDDENILFENPDGLKLRYSESDGFTTCDGVIKLFKDGELIILQYYLYPGRLTENEHLKKAYRKAKEYSVSPKDNIDFKIKWDSLKRIKKCYPTIFHIQPENKDIIRYYKYESNITLSWFDVKPDDTFYNNTNPLGLQTEI